jgi:putative SOS response-associated peptidase YedK
VCGRFVQTSSPDLLAAEFGVDEVAIEEPAAPDWNVTPREDVPTVVQRAPGRRTLEQMRWGLVPSWADGPAVGDRLVNARAESLRDKPAFQQAFRKRRCLIPADGFYEWQAQPGRRRKQPVFIHRRDGHPMAFAGLWEVWREHADDPWLVTCTIVTTPANATIEPIHDRMPALLPRDAWAEWLDRDHADLDALARLLVPAPDEDLDIVRVRTLVNDVRNNGPELVEPVPDDEVGDDGGQGVLFS